MTFLPLVFLSAWYARKGLKEVLKKLLLLNIFILFVVLSSLIAGEEELALLVFLRSNLILFSLLALLYNKDMYEISLALQELHFPSKLVSVFYFTIKSIYMFEQDFKKFIKTLKTRGFQAKTSLFTYQIYSNFFGALIIKAFYNAEQMQKMLVIREFNNKIYTIQKAKPIALKEMLLILFLAISFLHVGKIL
jgi:cobalt/nickel transport system permease protein